MATAKTTDRERSEQEVFVAMVHVLEAIRQRLGGDGFDAETVAIFAAAALYRRRRGRGPKALKLANAARAYLDTAKGVDVFERIFAKGLPRRDADLIDSTRERAIACFKLLRAPQSNAEHDFVLKYVAKNLTGFATEWKSDPDEQIVERLRARLQQRLPSSVDELLRWTFSAVGKGAWLNAKATADRKRKSRARVRRKIVTSSNVSK